MGTPQALEEDLARRIKAAQALSGKKTKVLASDLGWGISKLLRIRRGDQVPTAIELHQIAAATGQSIDFFFGASEVGNGTDGHRSVSEPDAVVKRGEAA